MKHKPEAFRRRKGHWVGADGFVCPKDFAEFYDRFPNYAQRWVAMNLRSLTYDRADVEEWTNELLLFLMQRKPRQKTRKISDAIETFDPRRCEGASKSRWFRYLDAILWNRFRDLLDHRKRDYLRKPNAFPINPDGTLGSAFHGAERSTDDVLDLGIEDVSQETAEAEHVKQEQRLHVWGYREFVAKHDPDLLPLMDAIATANTLRDAQVMLGWASNVFVAGRERLQILAECYKKGGDVPPRRKVYKARLAA
ncbi:MAG TPA: hypothetical protein VN577_10155 [Terriglobales bacterium]|nr:hypothetical protein [Terriglobales bacterium]